MSHKGCHTQSLQNSARNWAVVLFGGTAQELFLMHLTSWECFGVILGYMMWRKLVESPATGTHRPQSSL